jgi:DTW domain-containing protein YfiP
MELAMTYARKPTATYRPRSTARIFTSIQKDAERFDWSEAEVDARLASEGIIDPNWSRQRRAAALAAAAAMILTEEAA